MYMFNVGDLVKYKYTVCPVVGLVCSRSLGKEGSPRYNVYWAHPVYAMLEYYQDFLKGMDIK